MFRKVVALTLLVSGLVVIPQSSFAEPERGRLPDGRAFRTDVEGHQIVDYIAELEVTIEGLNRQVQSLEGELNDKNQALGRAARGEPIRPRVQERDLIASSQGGCPACPVQQCPNCDEELATLRHSYEAQLTSFRTQQQRQSAENEQLRGQLSESSSSADEAQIVKLKAELADSQNKIQTLQTQLERQSRAAASIQPVRTARPAERF